MAHGSRLPEPCLAVQALAERLQQTLAMPVAAAFLTCPPDAATAIERLVADGASQIIVMPYFLHAGRHVREDLPHLLDGARQRHPNCRFTSLPCLEGDPDLDRLLENRLRGC